MSVISREIIQRSSSAHIPVLGKRKNNEQRKLVINVISRDAKSGQLGVPARAHLSATHALVVVTVYGVSPTPLTLVSGHPIQHFAQKPIKLDSHILWIGIINSLFAPKLCNSVLNHVSGVRYVSSVSSTNVL